MAQYPLQRKQVLMEQSRDWWPIRPQRWHEATGALPMVPRLTPHGCSSLAPPLGGKHRPPTPVLHPTSVFLREALGATQAYFD